MPVPPRTIMRVLGFMRTTLKDSTENQDELAKCHEKLQTSEKGAKFTREWDDKYDEALRRVAECSLEMGMRWKSVIKTFLEARKREMENKGLIYHQDYKFETDEEAMEYKNLLVTHLKEFHLALLIEAAKRDGSTRKWQKKLRKAAEAAEAAKAKAAAEAVAEAAHKLVRQSTMDRFWTGADAKYVEGALKKLAIENNLSLVSAVDSLNTIEEAADNEWNQVYEQAGEDDLKVEQSGSERSPRRRLAVLEPAPVPTQDALAPSSEASSLVSTGAVALGVLTVGFLAYKVRALWKSFASVGPAEDLEAPREPLEDFQES